MRVNKGLTAEAGSRHAFTIAGQKNWPLPHDGQPGDWVEIPEDAPLKPHFSGLHFIKEDAVMSWGWERNFLAEYEGQTEESAECVVARRGRLVKELELSPEGWAQVAV